MGFFYTISDNSQFEWVITLNLTSNDKQQHYNFVQNLQLFVKYFLKWMWKLTFLTSFTYSLPPSTSNLVDPMATASKQLFTMRSLYVWGRCSFESFKARAELLRFCLLYLILWLVTRSVHDQSKTLSHMAHRGCYIKHQHQNLPSAAASAALAYLEYFLSWRQSRSCHATSHTAIKGKHTCGCVDKFPWSISRTERFMTNIWNLWLFNTWISWYL